MQLNPGSSVDGIKSAEASPLQASSDFRSKALNGRAKSTSLNATCDIEEAWKRHMGGIFCRYSRHGMAMLDRIKWLLVVILIKGHKRVKL